jgi:hypothetical protein
VIKGIHTASVSDYAKNNANDDPTSSWYWKRELLVYRSGLFDTLPEGFGAPRCYQIDEWPNGYRIWMEDVRDDVGTLWPLEHYRHVARHFGRFNGMYLAGSPLPTWPWLLSGFLAARLEHCEWPTFAKHYPELRHTNALVQRGWSDDLVVAFDRIWHECQQFLYVLATLPQTLLHNDSGRKNLMARRRAGGEFETIAVDWAQPAIGAVGEDLACMVTQPVYWLHGVHPDELEELDAIVFDAYVQGLADMGWQGDPALVRLGYTLSVVLRSGFGIFIFEWAARDEKTRRFMEHALGHPVEETIDAMRGLRSYIVRCAEEARQLIAASTVKSLL